MKYSIVKKVQDENLGGRKYESAELGIQDAESIEQAFEALDKLVEQYEKSLDDEQSGKKYSKRKKNPIDEAMEKNKGGGTIIESDYSFRGGSTIIESDYSFR